MSPFEQSNLRFDAVRRVTTLPSLAKVFRFQIFCEILAKWLSAGAEYPC